MPLMILIVDDDPGTRLSISDYLIFSGYSAIAAENGQEALALVDEYQPHLMITDIMMPQMDGYELVQRVRQKPSLRLLPVIFLTARTNTSERILGYRLGCDVYMPKPFELDELGAVVRNLLERSQLIEAQWRLAYQEAAKLIDTNTQQFSVSEEAIQSEKVETAVAISLTQREQEVLDLLTIGLSNAKMGDRLHLSPRTVEKYVSSLLRKTATSNRAELVRFALEHNLVD